MIIKSKELRWELPKHRGKAPRRQRAGYSCMTLGKNEGTLRRKHPSISNASGKVPRERTGDAIKNSAPIARPLLWSSDNHTLHQELSRIARGQSAVARGWACEKVARTIGKMVERSG